jgi:hypothetical protein
VLFVAMMNVPMVLLKEHDAAVSQWLDLLGLSVAALVSAFAFYTAAQRDIRQRWLRQMAVFPVFLAGSMGLSIRNTRAVVEALVGRRSSFERTPKCGPVGAGGVNLTGRYRAGVPRLETTFELLMASYFVFALALALYFGQYSIVPLQLLFLFGFGATGILSIRGAATVNPPGP